MKWYKLTVEFYRGASARRRWALVVRAQVVLVGPVIDPVTSIRYRIVRVVDDHISLAFCTGDCEEVEVERELE